MDPEVESKLCAVITLDGVNELKLLELLPEIPDINEVEVMGRSIIYRCVSAGLWDVVWTLLQQYDCCPNDSDKDHIFIHACLNNQLGIVKYMTTEFCWFYTGTIDVWDDYEITFMEYMSHIGGEIARFLETLRDDSIANRFNDVKKYLKHVKQESETAVANAMSNGVGELLQANVVIHGPPGAGKSSLKLLMLGQPPLPKDKQNATDILDQSVRTICVDRAVAAVNTANKSIVEVDNYELINRITAEVKAYANSNESTTKCYVFTGNPYDKSCTKFESSRSKSNYTSTGTSTSSAADGVTTVPEHRSLESSTNAHTLIEKAIQENMILDDYDPSCKIFDSRWLHYIDSGGQPQFLDALPLLYSRPSHSIVVIRLTDELDDHPKVRFYTKGSDKYSFPDELVLTIREMIIRMCQIALRVAKTSNSQFKPRVFVVGTHFDKLSIFSRSKRLQLLNEQLQPIYNEYSEVMVRKSETEFIFPIDTMSKGKQREQYSKELQDLILSETTKHSDKPMKIPLKWLTFQLELENSSSVSDGVVRMPQCLVVGGKLGIAKSDVLKALNFLKDVALILYYPDDIPDLVLTKVDPVTKRLSRLIQASFLPPSSELEGESKKLKDKGLFNKRFLEELSDDQSKKYLSDDEFLKLLVSLKLAIYDQQGKEYFLPSALSLTPPSGSKFNNGPTPLAMIWDNLILPHGFFLTVAVELLQGKSVTNGHVFELRKDQPQWRGEIQLSEANLDIPGVIKLADRQTWIQVSYSGANHNTKDVYDAVNRATERARERFKNTVGAPKLGCLCPCAGKPHFATFSKDMRSVTCSEDLEIVFFKEDITCWGKGAATNSLPQDSLLLTSVMSSFPKDTSPETILSRNIQELTGVVSEIDLKHLADSLSYIDSANVKPTFTLVVESRYFRAKTLFDKFQAYLVECGKHGSMQKQVEELAKFTAKLESQNNDALKTIAKKMKCGLILSKSPVLSHMLDLLRDKQSDWYAIGEALKVSYDYRRGIRQQGVMTDNRNKLEDVLHKWEQSQCSDVTWRNVIDVFYKLKYKSELKNAKQFLEKEETIKEYFQ